VIDVLVVDDDFMVARIHRGFVERTDGFQVVGVAHTGADALEQVRALEPDLVLLDIYLPDLGGLEVLSEIRRVAPEVDVLVISAAREAETVRRAWRGGVVHYLMKPFTYDALRERLEHYAHAHQGLRVGTTAEQADVDRIFGVRPAAGDDRMQKGLSPQTRQLVERELTAAGTLSAAECAAAVGISRVSARRYLEFLAARGAAEVSLRYGTTGRPERRYTWNG